MLYFQKGCWREGISITVNQKNERGVSTNAQDCHGLRPATSNQLARIQSVALLCGLALQRIEEGKGCMVLPFRRPGLLHGRVVDPIFGLRRRFASGVNPGKLHRGASLPDSGRAAIIQRARARKAVLPCQFTFMSSYRSFCTSPRH